MEVKSGLLTNVDYNEQNQTLTVTFTNGKRWQYSGVSYDDYANLISSQSIGKYFIANIQKVKEGKEI